LTAFNLSNIVMRKISIFLGIIGLLFAAYYLISSGAESTQGVVLLPRSPDTTALQNNLVTPTAAVTVITTNNAPSLEEQIKALEASGALPKLDRSTSIKGPDRDLNGVRDDIDTWIAALPISDSQKKAAIQKAIGLQNTLLLDIKDKVAMDASGDELSAGVQCLGNVFMPIYQEGYTLGAKLEALTANTRERAHQYIKYNRAASGSSTASAKGNPCK
jgi:hypothetical protein